MLKNITLLILFIACNIKGAAASEIFVSAASDLTGAFKEIGTLYEKESGNRAIFNFGSTGILAQQIEGGAPVDLFAAANRTYIDNLERKGLIVPETKRVYAIGGIVLATAKGKTRLRSLQGLLMPEIKRVAMANPSHAPYGMAAKEAMEKTGVWDKVRDRVVYAENIRQAMQYLDTGDVDAAIVALSLCVNSDVNCTIIPQETHSPIEQTLAVIKAGNNLNAAKGFADFVAGTKGRAILERYGFGLPVEKRR